MPSFLGDRQAGHEHVIGTGGRQNQPAGLRSASKRVHVIHHHDRVVDMSTGPAEGLEVLGDRGTAHAVRRLANLTRAEEKPWSIDHPRYGRRKLAAEVVERRASWPGHVPRRWDEPPVGRAAQQPTFSLEECSPYKVCRNMGRQDVSGLEVTHQFSTRIPSSLRPGNVIEQEKIRTIPSLRLVFKGPFDRRSGTLRRCHRLLVRGSRWRSRIAFMDWAASTFSPGSTWL